MSTYVHIGNKYQTNSPDGSPSKNSKGVGAVPLRTVIYSSTCKSVGVLSIQSWGDINSTNKRKGRAMKTSEETSEGTSSVKVQHVLVRGRDSGVFFGILVSERGTTVELRQCRHIWSWAGAANVADMGIRGVSDPGECKFVAPAWRVRVLDAIQIVYCTPEATASLAAVPEWLV